MLTLIRVKEKQIKTMIQNDITCSPIKWQKCVDSIIPMVMSV